MAFLNMDFYAQKQIWINCCYCLCCLFKRYSFLLVISRNQGNSLENRFLVIGFARTFIGNFIIEFSANFLSGNFIEIYWFQRFMSLVCFCWGVSRILSSIYVELFCKNIFAEKLHHRYLTGSKTRLWQLFSQSLLSRKFWKIWQHFAGVKFLHNIKCIRKQNSAWSSYFRFCSLVPSAIFKNL